MAVPPSAHMGLTCGLLTTPATQVAVRADEAGAAKPSVVPFLRVAAASKGVVLAPALSYHDVRRLVEIDGEEVYPKEGADGDDLGEALVDACRDLETEERVGSTVVSVEPLQSVAALTALRPRDRSLATCRCLSAFVTYLVPKLVAWLCTYTACSWKVDPTIRL